MDVVAVAVADLVAVGSAAAGSVPLVLAAADSEAADMAAVRSG